MSDARGWFKSIDSALRDETLLHETDQGVFGIQEVVADFDEADLHKLRAVAQAIRTPEREGVQGAIALAGSAAQSKFQPFPGDCDYFERVHIRSESREEALATLVSLMVETIARVFPHPDLQFSEMIIGHHLVDSVRDGKLMKAGTPIRWNLEDVDTRAITVQDEEGKAVLLELADVADDPGFVKLDWIHADPHKEKVVAVSKVIDATWESPDGEIVPLDGVVDSFYQEVYLDPDSKEYVEKLIQQVKPAGLSHYVEQLEKEVRKYCGDEPNYGKVAKRLYNIFRITNRAQAAAHLRELFDDPAARLYQLPSTLQAVGQSLAKRRLAREVIEGHVDRSVEILRDCYEGADRDEMIAVLERLPELDENERDAAIERIGTAAGLEVSAYFEEKLNEDDEIRAYLVEISSKADG